MYNRTIINDNDYNNDNDNDNNEQQEHAWAGGAPGADVAQRPGPAGGTARQGTV